MNGINRPGIRGTGSYDIIKEPEELEKISNIGVVNLSRVSSWGYNKKKLVGTSFQQEDFFEITISLGEISHRNNMIRYLIKNELVKFSLSKAQLTSLIFDGNRKNIPCTLEYVSGFEVDDEVKDVQQKFDRLEELESLNKIKNELSEFNDTIFRRATRIREKIYKPTSLTRSDKDTIQHELDSIISGIRNSVKHFLDSLGVITEETIRDAIDFVEEKGLENGVKQIGKIKRIVKKNLEENLNEKEQEKREEEN